MGSKYNIPRGTFDILPEESYKWQYVTEIFRKISDNYNYREIVTPIFEVEELFERSVGDSTDIVQKEMYRFKDRKGRLLALRPEGTAPVVRSFVENNLDKKDNSSKLYYLGPMFRYDRPQKGRYRQFYQYGIENIGSNDPYIDAEVIAVGYDFLKKLGLKNFVLEINSIGCKNCTKIYDNALVNYFTPFLDSLCPDCKTRIRKNPKRLLDCKVPGCKKITQNAPSMLDYLDEECKQDFEQVQNYLNILEIPFKINPRIVRGLDYYNKTAFEFINNNLGAQDALLGGGRYDGLIEQFGGKDIPGIGFAGGFERLIFSMENENLSFGKQQTPDVFFVTLGEEAKRVGISLIAKVRKAEVSAENAPDKESLKAQMKAADKSKAKFSLILGQDELSQKKIILKNMENGQQELIEIDKFIEVIKKNIK